LILRNWTTCFKLGGE